MRRATVTIDDELEGLLDAYIGKQDVSPSLNRVVHTALDEFLARRGFSGKPKRLRITPASKGSGQRDISVRHDFYLTEE